MNIIYYTCNTHPKEISDLCREYLSKIKLPIISVSLNETIDFGDKRLILQGKRGADMMRKQIIAGLEASDAEYVFLAESDVLYHPSHFEFIPEKNDVCYYNTNVWKMRWSDGFIYRTDNSQQLSGMVANRLLLLDYYIHHEFHGHYEPRTIPRVNYESTIPNICIRHDKNMSVSKWSPKDFRNKEYAKGWKEDIITNIYGYHDFIFR